MVESIINRKQLSEMIPQKSALTPKETALLTRMKAVGKGGIFLGKGALAKELKQVKPLEVDKMLQVLCDEIFLDDQIKDPAAFFDRIADVLPLDQMQEAVKEEFGDVFKASREMFEEAKLYLQMHEGKISVSKKVQMEALFDKVINVIDSFIAGFGLGDFFKPANNQMDEDSKTYKIMNLLSLFSMLSALLIPIAGASIAGLVVGGVLISIAALSLIWPKIRPRTNHLPAEAKNLTASVQKRGFVAQGRKEVLDEVAKIIKMGRHALLIGPPRVGKSSTTEALAEAIARGDYPELKGKVVFRINAGKIVGYQASYRGGGNPILSEISAAMGKHRDKIILVFDEIHMTCKKNEPIADQMKTYLDEYGDFPHVIGITTYDEYKDYVMQNPAFDSRFDKVMIENTSKDETLKILSDAVLKSDSNPLLGEGVLEEIYNQTEALQETTQPLSSVIVLKRCIAKSEKTQRTESEKKIIDVSNQVKSLVAQAAAKRGKNRAAQELIAKLNAELKELQSQAALEQKEFDGLFRAKSFYDGFTKDIYKTAMKVSALSEKHLSKRDELQAKRLILLSQYVAKSLEKMMEKKAKTLHVKLVIDKEMVEAVIPEVFPAKAV